MPITKLPAAAGLLLLLVGPGPRLAAAGTTHLVVGDSMGDYR